MYSYGIFFLAYGRNCTSNVECGDSSMICDQDSTCACAPMFTYKNVIPTKGYYAGRSTKNLNCVPGKTSKRIVF